MKKIFFAALLILASAGCRQNGEQAEPASDFETITISRSDITFEKSYPASIEGRQSIRIIPRVEGYLREIHVKEGQKVSKGQILFVIDQASYLAEVKSAKANVSVADANVETAQLYYDSRTQLHSKQIVSDYDLRSASISLEMSKAQALLAQAQLEAAENNLSYTVLRSPSDGVVGSLPYRIGDYVGPSAQDGLTVIADNKEMYVYFSMTERDVMGRLSVYGSLGKSIEAFPPLTLKLSDGSEYSEKGRLESISGIVEKSTGALSARAVFNNPDGRLLSGSTGLLAIPHVSHQVIVIPQTATYEIQDKIYCYKVVDGTAESVIISVDTVNDGVNYVVRNGLSEGEVIVSKGASYVKEGQKIE